MRLSKLQAVLLLVATLLPFDYIICFVLGVLFLVLGGLQGVQGPQDPAARRWFVGLMVVHMSMAFWIWGLIAFYVIYLFRTKVVPKDQKALWAVALFLGSILAMPIFWYLYIWKTPARRDDDPYDDPRPRRRRRVDNDHDHDEPI